MKIVVDRANLDATIRYLRKNDLLSRGQSVEDIEKKIRERLAEKFGGVSVEEAQKRYLQGVIVWNGVVALFAGQFLGLAPDEFAFGFTSMQAWRMERMY